MDLISQQPGAWNDSQQRAENSRRYSRGLNWDTYKEEIRSIYRENTLQATMRYMEEKYHFKARSVPPQELLPTSPEILTLSILANEIGR